MGLKKPHIQYKRLGFIKKIEHFNGWNESGGGLAFTQKWEDGGGPRSTPFLKILTKEAVTTKPASLFQSAPQGMVLTF